MSQYDPNFPEGPDNLIEVRSIEKAREAPELPAKRTPQRHRHLHVDGSINSTIIEQVRGTLPRSYEPEELPDIILARLGYQPGRFDRMSRRVARWKAGKSATHRMPSHIKVAATAVALVEAVQKDLIDNPPSVGRAIKNWAKKIGSEVKEAMA